MYVYILHYITLHYIYILLDFILDLNLDYMLYHPSPTAATCLWNKIKNKQGMKMTEKSRKKRADPEHPVATLLR